MARTTSTGLLRSASAAAVLSTLLLAACGGGGGGAADSSGSGSGTSGGTTSSGSPTDGAAGTSDGSSGSTTTGSTSSTSAGIGISDAVATTRALAASALLSLGLPDLPTPAAALAHAGGTVYHVDSANGSDANDGLAAVATGGSGPWKTLARVMQGGLAAGDIVELACGSVWHETLRLPVDGNAGQPVLVRQPTAGCTTAPTIDGGVSLAPSAWSPYRGNLYVASLADAPLGLLSTTGVLTEAHFPNPQDVAADPGSPYLALAADSNGAVLTTGPDFVLPSGATIDGTTHVRVRTNNYIIDDSTVASFDGTHLTLAKAPTYTVASGWGYYLTGQLWMLRAAGEWSYDATAKLLYAWMPDSAAPSTAVTVATLALGIDLQGRQHVVVDGVAVRNAGFAVDMRSTTDVNVRNMTIEDIAGIGIDAAGSSQDIVESNRIARTKGDAITGWGGATGPLLADSTGFTVRNNVVRDSSVLMSGDQVLSLPIRSLAAIFIGSNSTASANTIVNAGYIGILAQTGDTVQNNFVYGACSVLDDCGGIYTGGAYNGSTITGNTVVHSRGSLHGQPVASRATAAQGIYVDDKGSDLVVQGNTVVDTDFGIQLHNATRNVVRGNHLYGNRRGQLWMQEDSAELNPNGDMSANQIDGNLIAAVAPAAIGVQMTTRFTSTAAFGTFTSNRYYDQASQVDVYSSSSTGGRGFTFANWQGSTGYGSTLPVDSQGHATSADGYTTYSVTGSNIVPNGSFLADAAGWSNWNATAPAGQAVRSACPAGYCLQYTAGGSDGVLSSPGFAVQQGAWYRLAVDVSTQTDNQAVPLIVRIGSGTYASVSDRSLQFTGNRAWTRHAVIFQATGTVTGAGARVDIDGIKAGQSVTLSNLELVQVTPDPVALMSGVMVNGGANAMSVACPFSSSQPALCAQLYDFATDLPINWPLNIPAHSSVIVYAREPQLVDTDGDGIPDSQDSCPDTAKGASVNAAGCEFGAH